MINFKDELQRFKPSMDVDDIEDAIIKMDLTDMNDIMFQMMEKMAAGKAEVPKKKVREEEAGL